MAPQSPQKIPGLDKPEEEIRIPEAELDKMITPPEKSNENTATKVAMRK